MITAANTTRPPAVAGLFYPGDANELQDTVDQLLEQAATDTAETLPAIRAIIAPHAGYIYSGPVAAAAYRQLSDMKQRIKRVAVLGPSHRVALGGLAVPDSEYFSTPLGRIALDNDTIIRLLHYPQVSRSNLAHSQEHSLEVQLPFLQRLLGNDFRLIPIVVGDASTDDVADIISMLLDDGDDLLVVISSDLSHYHDYTSAQALDDRTSAAIETLQEERIGYEDACGCNPIRGLLHVARQRGWHAHTLDLRNSGDTAGDKSRVVGYGAYVINE
jgi:AmmeMemoRadiSam system protein B